MTKATLCGVGIMCLFDGLSGGLVKGDGFSEREVGFPRMKIKTKQISKDKGPSIKIRVHQGFLPMSRNLSASGPTIHAAHAAEGITGLPDNAVVLKIGDSKIRDPINAEMKTEPKYQRANPILPILTGQSLFFLSFAET